MIHLIAVLLTRLAPLVPVVDFSYVISGYVEAGYVEDEA